MNAILRPAVCAKLLTIEIFLDGETCTVFPGGYEHAPDYDQGYAGGNEVAYCHQRLRSDDPGSGTSMGFDGVRHPCP